MNLLRHGFLFAALMAALPACGGGDDDARPKFIGSQNGGRSGTGARPGSGGRTGSGGGTASGGAETGGADGGVDGGSGGTSSGGSGGGTSSGGSGGTSSGGSGGSGGSGDGGAGGTGGAGGAVVEPTCTLSTGNEICDGCIHSDCSFQCAACEGNEDCVALVDCVLTTCTSGFNSECVNACRSQYPDGSELFNDVVFNCGRPACSSFCPFVQ